MFFAVTAMDFKDPEALERRLAHREEHLTNVNIMIADGSFLSGGAILDDTGIMIGSSLHLQFDSRAELDSHLQGDPYVAGKVWEKITVYELKRVPMT